MRKLILPSLVFLSLLSCKKDNSDNLVNTYTPEISVNEDEVQLKNRIKILNETVGLKRFKTQTLNFIKVAEVIPTFVNGCQLSASGVDRIDDKVYVTYHIRGEKYGGEILTFDVSDEFSPVVKQSIVDNHADFNDVFAGQHKSYIWLAGARDVTVSGYANTNGAIAGRIKLKGSKVPNGSFDWEAPFKSYSASSITRVPGATNMAWITSGSKGGLFVVQANNPNNVLHSRPQVREAKHFDYDGSKGVFLDGDRYRDSSQVHVYDLNSLFSFNSYSIPYDVTKLGKNGVEVDGDYAYLAMGDDGVVKFDIVNGVIVDTFKFTGSGYANSVVVDDNWIYIAYGEDGLIILDKSTFIIKAQYDFNGSCNYINLDSSFVYLANGKTGGLIILKKI